MKQIYSSRSNETNEKQLESYSDYKDRKYDQTLKTSENLIQNVCHSSLNDEDKKILLLRVKAQLEERMVQL